MAVNSKRSVKGGCAVSLLRAGRLWLTTFYPDVGLMVELQFLPELRSQTSPTLTNLVFIRTVQRPIFKKEWVFSGGRSCFCFCFSREKAFGVRRQDLGIFLSI